MIFTRKRESESEKVSKLVFIDDMNQVATNLRVFLSINPIPEGLFCGEKKFET